MTDQVWLTLQLLTTLVLVGVIWFVQIVHYPLFEYVGEDRFEEYERQHVRRTGWIVGPLMLAEMSLAIGMLTTPIGRNGLAMVALALLAATWVSTFAIQRPLHSKLCQTFDARRVQMLVATNWFRTFAWSGRGALLCVLLLRS